MAYLDLCEGGFDVTGVPNGPHPNSKALSQKRRRAVWRARGNVDRRPNTLPRASHTCSGSPAPARPSTSCRSRPCQQSRQIELMRCSGPPPLLLLPLDLRLLEAHVVLRIGVIDDVPPDRLGRRLDTGRRRCQRHSHLCTRTNGQGRKMTVDTGATWGLGSGWIVVERTWIREITNKLIRESIAIGRSLTVDSMQVVRSAIIDPAT